MKVIYEKTVTTKIREAVMDADKTCRRIEKIVLTEAESEQLKRECRALYHGLFVSYLFGVRLEIEKPTLNTGQGGIVGGPGFDLGRVS